MDALADRVIRDGGTPESIWLPWLADKKMSSISLESLCPGQSRLVVVAPHPDDEILACGGLLAMQASRCRPVLVIAVTDGEASHGATDKLVSQQLAEVRKCESLRGLHKLGLSPSVVIRLGLPDGGVSTYGDDLAETLQRTLRPDDTVVTTWRLDGHPDHEAVSAATALACASMNCKFFQCPVWMWHWSHPEDGRIAWSELAALALPAGVLRLKLQALDCHRSQLIPRQGGQPQVLVPTIVDRAARSFEYFFS